MTMTKEQFKNSIIDGIKAGALIHATALGRSTVIFPSTTGR
ncbi:Protein of unknown function [Lactobacillus delbrueckii subsp. bulgaricus]|nr:Protein of unknown function [Lactobacillus delbrueckii subsp. bulgaricus]